MNRWFCFLFASVLGNAAAAESVKLTLPDAIRMALAQNKVVKISRLKVTESEQKKAAARSAYFPEIKNQSSVLHTTELQNIEIPAGALGAIPGIGPVPGRSLIVDQGSQTLITSGTMATQPLTPLIRIRQANKIAASEIAASKDEVKKAENEVAVKVHEVYYGILIAHLQKQAVEQEQTFARTRLRESEEDVRNGTALKVAVIEGQAGLLQSEQALLTIDLRLADLNSELNNLLGLPLDTELELSPVQAASFDDHSREVALSLAIDENPEIAVAREKVRQAKAAVTAAKSACIPDIAAFARQSYQNGVPFVVHNFGTFGVALSYDVFDFGKRRAVIREREAQLAQAQENVERLKDAIGVQIDRSYNKVKRTRQMLQVAAEVVRLRTESERLAQNQMNHGVVLVSATRQASAASFRAQADMLQAELAHLLARAELEQTIGRTPGR